MGMQVIPTFKSMNLTAPMANQQMILKRNEDFVRNMLESWKLNSKTVGAYTITDKSSEQMNLLGLQDMMNQMFGGKNAYPFGIGHIKQVPHK